MQITSNGKTRRSEAEWRELISRFEKSGLSEKEFCRREEISHLSLVRWRRKLMTSAASRSFVPVTAESPPPSPWSLVVTLPTGCQLRFEG
jgi:hypothetical protein